MDSAGVAVSARRRFDDERRRPEARRGIDGV